jgi:hypothetical protein
MRKRKADRKQLFPASLVTLDCPFSRRRRKRRRRKQSGSASTKS